MIFLFLFDFFSIIQADRAYGTEISPRSFVISFVILLYAISYNICSRLRSHTVDVTPPQAATKIMAGMAEQQMEWRNREADGMVEWREWREWRNGRKNGRIAEWQK
jgi:hypothetical protein